jgi:hypothetical protein
MKLHYLILLLLPGLLCAPALANRGSMVTGLERIALEETGQRAIVAWNGTEEILILSTDMKSSQSVVVLEVIPLPSNPAVFQGNSESFKTLAHLLTEKMKTREENSEGVEVTFHQKIGAHDVTVTKVNDLSHFEEWITQFTQEKGIAFTEIPPEFRQTISHYIGKSINYFVFDVVEINESTQSIDPLVYQFKSNYLYYPLEITATSDIGHSNSRVTLLLITEEKIDILKLLKYYPQMGYSSPMEFTREELERVSPSLDLFGGPAFVMSVFYSGPLNVLTEDIVYPEHREFEEGQPVASESIAAALSGGVEPSGHTKIMAVLWIVILFLAIAAVNRSS